MIHRVPKPAYLLFEPTAYLVPIGEGNAMSIPVVGAVLTSVPCSQSYAVAETVVRTRKDPWLDYI